MSDPRNANGPGAGDDRGARPIAEELQELVRRAQQEARRAREDAQRAKDEAMRLRGEARDIAKKIRDELRDESRRARDAGRAASRAGRGHGFAPNHGHRDWSQWAGAGPSGGRGPGSGIPWGGFGPPSRTPDGPSGDEQVVEQPLTMEGIERVDVSLTAGKLTLRPCAQGETSGVKTWSQRTEPKVEVRRDGSRLKIDIQAPKGWLFRRGSGVSSDVRLPAGLKFISVDLGAGELSAYELTAGRFGVHMGAGTARLRALSAELEVDVGAGKAIVSDHRGVVRCAGGTGNVLIDIAELVPGDYSVNLGVGRAEVRLPADQAVTFRANKGLGRLRIDYPDAGPGAPVRIKLDGGVGEVVVRSRREGQPAPEPAPEPKGRVNPVARRREADELRILEMLEQGKINSREAAELISALHGAGSTDAPAAQGGGAEAQSQESPTSEF